MQHPCFTNELSHTINVRMPNKVRNCGQYSEHLLISFWKINMQK